MSIIPKADLQAIVSSLENVKDPRATELVERYRDQLQNASKSEIEFIGNDWKEVLDASVLIDSFTAETKPLQIAPTSHMPFGPAPQYSTPVSTTSLPSGKLRLDIPPWAVEKPELIDGENSRRLRYESFKGKPSGYGFSYDDWLRIDATYHDSSGFPGKQYLNIVKQWLRLELQDAWIEGDRTAEKGGSQCQPGLSSSGVFVCTNALKICLELQRDMEGEKGEALDYRKWLAVVLMRAEKPQTLRFEEQVR